ncbi:MAG: ABC-F family ATP-binding cassette domain-containing protein [Deltaproteobacteria bacterium]|nr:ABC-F family ATP-binding cassette domain-containing protein [Deltaproteobacteria bacterium]
MIHLDGVSTHHGRQILLLDVSLAVFAGERVGLVGPNGSGKSTIFRLIVGEEHPDGGQISTDRGLVIGYFSQDVGELQGRTVLEETVAGAGEVAVLAGQLHELEQAMADPDRVHEIDLLVERYGEAQARFEALDGYSLKARARAILAGLGFRPAAVDADTSNLSGGWKMRVALARILLMRPDALLLDEPTNHLDIESIIWLEQFLREFRGALIITSHDRAFLNRVVTRIVEIDAGELRTFSGDYDFYEAQRDLLGVQAEAQFARQEAMLAKERAFIERFKARASHAAQVQSRQKKLEKMDLIQPPKRRKAVRFNFRPPPRSGEDVVKIEGVHKSYGDLQVYGGFDLLLRRGERWCVMGINGAGKSTLLKLVAGTTEPDAGSVTVGASVKMGYFAQHAMEQLDPTITVVETLRRAFPTASIGNMLSLAGAFGFSGDEVEKTCRVLSGGEKARLVIARMLYDPPNFLVLDEPTNHLDMATKEMLVQSLSSYEGSMLFVSHDRAFLTALSNRVLELDDGSVQQYSGGYTEYVQRSGREAPGVSR